MRSLCPAIRDEFVQAIGDGINMLLAPLIVHKGVYGKGKAACIIAALS
jgi:hypothetical protein